ncbi:carbohydrate ABC transporter permease [Paenibacillus mucilaginosus]|uniref:Sugar ABC transporter permease n=3 Tax=Paenibacillus mucilaginosus TaxID=61624 RepID=H6NE56_9BACL|nr:carbohydrate ABC transporter permease [Paenibacillus mucilaginosus]AEI46216.1 sugar ABC transporter permease [Paenibacillus mucilaginosus KNP414]AFC33832.1 sugar ABC transporter permease [Paenibacillus mucilaginosus 3016]AFH66158.1 sugar ABC transporter permease [Paenibacillus mucilaginosus K02]MCG7213657.1 carbohydrate ABC transporter permease [Paenibacillus mucilaginosus]WDM27536.1 carbohydrate ABC transporter permease [Paenibacillus mucilaginosus]
MAANTVEVKRNLGVESASPRRTAWLGSALVYTGMGLGALASLFPFYWLFVMSTATTADMFRFPPRLLPGDQLLVNINKVLDGVGFFQSFGNSLIVAVLHTAMVLFFCSMAGFAFAKFDFPAKKPLFLFLLLTMMVPQQLGLIPQFIIMQKLGWINELKALIIPGAASAFGIFWMRQYTDSVIHDELINAGRIDGCRSFDLYWLVALPILKPALATLGIITFLGSWNDYLWPLVVISVQEKFTLQMLIASMNGVYSTDYSMVMAATLMATVPLIVVFTLFSRQFIAGLMQGSVKD